MRRTYHSVAVRLVDFEWLSCWLVFGQLFFAQVECAHLSLLLVQFIDEHFIFESQLSALLFAGLVFALILIFHILDVEPKLLFCAYMIPYLGLVLLYKLLKVLVLCFCDAA